MGDLLDLRESLLLLLSLVAGAGRNLIMVEAGLRIDFFISSLDFLRCFLSNYAFLFNRSLSLSFFGDLSVCCLLLA